MPTSVIMPKFGLVPEGKVIKWLRKEGDKVEQGEPLLEIESEKVNVQIEAPASGVLSRIIVREDVTVPAGETLAFITQPGEAVPTEAAKEAAPPAPAEAEAPAEAAPAAATSPRGEERFKVSPLARRLAAELNVDLSTVTGSGPGGRIVKEDVLQAAERAKGAAAVAVPTPPAAAEVGVELKAQKVVPLTGMRKVIAERMMHSLHTSAQLTLTTEADVSHAIKLRESILPEFERRFKVKVSYTDIIVKCAATALQDFPILNSAVEKDGIHIYDAINVGVAVALESGLIVPVVRNVEGKVLHEISATLNALTEKARAGKLTIEDVSNGTFTVSNLGMFGVDAFTPITNPPQTAILGVGRIVDKPVAIGNRVEIRPMVTLSLTFDHRAADGAVGAQYLQRVKHLLENPASLLL